MDRVKKFLRKLSPSDQDDIGGVLQKIKKGNTEGLNVKKLRGYTNLFRVRKGDIRIVFHQEDGNFNVIFIGRRGDSKYNQF